MNIKTRLITVAFWTILRKEIVRFTRIWVQTMVPPAITMSLYFLIFGNLIGPRIGMLHGVSYIQFIVPGLIMMSVITSSYANVVASFFGARFQRSIEELIVSPVPYIIILLGFVLGGMLRGILVGIIVTLVSLLFHQLHIAHTGLMLLVVCLTAALFAIAGLVNAIFARKFDDINVVPTFILTPLTYLGGVFYSVDMLNPFWQKITHFNPVFYIINAFRYGFIDQSDVSIYFALMIIIFFVIALFSIAYTLLLKGVGIKE